MSSYDETEFKKILHTVCDRNVEILITSVSNLKFETLKKKKVDILVVILNSTLGAYNLIVINNKKKVIDVHNSRGSKIISIENALKKVFSKNEYIFNRYFLTKSSSILDDLPLNAVTNAPIFKPKMNNFNS